jgi:hypothetical protein
MNKAPFKTSPTRELPKNEGEGNRSADREYRAHVARHVKSGCSEPAADEAARALEGEEADDLREAEQTGKTRSESASEAGEQGADDDEGQRERH